MKLFLHRMLEAASGRRARNIYFWLLLAYSRSDYHYTPVMVVFTAMLFCEFALLFYGNNLLLIPRLLSKRKYGAYIVAYALLVWLTALLFTGTLKYIVHYHPQIKTWMISPLVEGSETPELSLASLIRETGAYYISLAVAGSIFALSWYISSYRELQRQIAEIRQKHEQAELGFLKAQLNPHFLFNTLNNLYTLTLSKSDTAPSVVEGLSVMMRYFLGESNAALVPVEKEREMMKAYIALELLRINNKEDLRFTIKTDRHYKIPPLLWLPLLENVFKHGTGYISDHYEVEFTFTILDGELHIYSKNAVKASGAGSTKGIGLSNLQKRLQLLYPNRYEFSAGLENAYFVTNVKIRLVP